MEFLQTLFGYVDSLTWGWSLIPILVVFGVFITIMSGFVQFEFFGRMFRVLSGKNQNSDPNNLSARQALLVSVGGRVGGGNIAGVAVAITLGGPGAVFWMWCIALIGMATSLVECTLAQIYKRTDGEHSFRGGPADYIRHGLGSNYNWLAIVYAVCLLAAFGLGFNAFQGNTVAGAMQDSFGISRLVTGALLVLVTGFVIFGGIKRIAKAADVVVPVMALGYLALALIVIVMNIGEIPALFVRIVSSAFGYEEAIAGGMGAAIAQGLRRGLFSNEAGLGSAPNVAATALVHHPVSQGITQSFSVFIDTIVICSCTAFIILLGDVYVAGATGIDGVVLTQQSLASHFGEWSRYALSVAILLFAFSSIIYNVYLGENALAAITPSKPALMVLRVLILGLIFLGAAAPNATSVFFFSDPMMGILALVNLIAILMLFPTAIRVINDFRAQLKAGVARPVFDPAKFPDLDLDRKAWDINRWK
ncbi:alanine/glycine:cation symporter family protein [Pseudomonas fluorescens]|uniref:Alanine:cation symporter family protein n=1 Tax=Pseudomonas fluorescens TaxID=294 RepID=A0A944DJT9_PSEFL|nr:alanine/glycine:cation symporter family protein [Pseudomonas fluorescens]MBT2297072.1 alanine:cation symporter family protein [Pseudomonas fluorescens]MBT2306272.1 alanine:cation symporter family protein [Pseudomonas fluorescens]MBT2310674.1 alanine:cation symporter family protein [Pseudomonas fluorescens]MBT2319026.1 alanine:cation symporter family protein [Pseudomonas fluorescens]MBT2328245.1 alanine:cation symporter family protein [Pseudomonas fluorescens]